MKALWQYLSVFGVALLPILELRASIPFGVGLNLSPVGIYLCSVIGNFLPVPFILLFIRRILAWMQGKRFLGKIADFILRKAHRNTAKVMRYATFGLFLFVAIPLPVTGAWTGALVAAVLDMRLKYALPSIFCGVLVAGLIVSLICYGFLGFLSFLV